MGKKLSLKLKSFFTLSLHDVLLTIAILLCAMALCLLMSIIDVNDMYSAMIFVIAVLIISRVTNGYFYGTAASFIGVICVNFAFTYPYFVLDFSISGYPLTFICMLAASIIISTLTTQIKQQEKFRIEAEREKTRGNLLRAVSHDLRTPLTSIIGSISAVLENEEVFTKETKRELLTESKDNAQWLIRMVENLLSITRINQEETKITKTYEAVEEIIGESVSKFKKNFTDANVSVSVPDELLMVPMDAILIEQVIFNLLENAVIHGENTTLITLSVYKEDKKAVFVVSDNGIGIKDEEFVHLFDGYLRTKDELNADSKRNMGIGLSVCMTIVNAHGGNMTVKNNKNGGAVFSFTLPLTDI